MPKGKKLWVDINFKKSFTDSRAVKKDVIKPNARR